MKYELVIDADYGVNGPRRIRALRDIPRYNVKAGDLGGLVESAANFSQRGDCWIGYSGRARNFARVEHDAYVGDGAVVTDRAYVTDDAWVTGYVLVRGSARVCSWARVRTGTLPQAIRSDGYDFSLMPAVNGKTVRVMHSLSNATLSYTERVEIRNGYLLTAGCRTFVEFDAAREFWRETRGGTPLGEETQAILDHLERLYLPRILRENAR